MKKAHIRKLTYYGWMIAKDIGLVSGAVLSFVGVLALSGWATPDILSDFTPLALGSFSIAMAFITLRISLHEAWERANAERDQNVQPVFILKRPEEPVESDYHIECFCRTVKDPRENCSELLFSLENVGRGTAFDINIFVRDIAGSLYRAAYPLPRIKADETANVSLTYSLPSQLIIEIVTVSSDMFDNSIFSSHDVIHHSEGTNYTVVGNHNLLSDDKEEERRVCQKLYSKNFCSEIDAAIEAHHAVDGSR